MARYFFNLYNDETSLDEEGTELPDDSAAREWAKLEVRYMASESVKAHAHLVLHHHVIVTNEAGEEVTTVRFGDVVSVME